jgi:hypothetical protein
LRERLVKVQKVERGQALVWLSLDEVWTLRHCCVEALEAIGNEVEFKVRVGAPRSDAEEFVDGLKTLGLEIERLSS